MGEVIKKIRLEKINGIIIVAPIWRTAHWWPQLEKMTVDRFDIPVQEPVYATENARQLPPPRRTTVRLISADRIQETTTAKPYARSTPPTSTSASKTQRSRN